MKNSPSRCGMYTVLLLTLAVFVSGASADSLWTFLRLKGHAGHLYRTSSELQAPADNSFGRYGMHRLFDNDPKTCWAEGAAYAGIGTTLYLAVPAATPSLSIANGYQKSLSLYRANNRVKSLRLAMYVGFSREGEVTELFTVYHAQIFEITETIDLQDIFGFQKITLPFDWQKVRTFKDKILARFKGKENIADASMKLDVRYILQFTILDVFKGNRYDDTCISEIKINTVPPAGPAVEKVYINPAENTIYMDTQTAPQIILDRDLDAIFQIIDTSSDRQWVIAIKMPAELDDSRAETTYVLYSTHLKRQVPAKILGSEVGEMYDFAQAGKTIYLNYLNNKTGQIERLDLNAVFRQLAGSN